MIGTPGLKAKDIARHLGVTRKVVNIFLHQNKDRYFQDEDYGWRYIEQDQVEIVLPGLWVTADDFEECLPDSKAVLLSSAVDVIFSKNCHPMIDCTARLLAMINQFAHQGIAVSLDFNAALSTSTYLNRAGFFDNLHPEIEVIPERPTHSAARRYKGQSDTLVEFGEVDPGIENDELINQLTQTFVAQSSQDYLTAAFTVFSELIKNVAEHSQTPISGFAGLQRYKGRRKHIQTVVSDSGIGIATSLRPALKTYYPPLFRQYGSPSLENDMGLVAEAMSQGNISRSGGAHGLGFKSSREQAVKFNAQFSVRQETYCLKFFYRDGELVEVQRQPGLMNLLGTHICFDFDLA